MTKRTGFVLSSLLMGSALLSQTLDTGILGTVTDPTGAAIATAAVTITQAGTGIRRALQTSADGKYDARYLVPGEYTVEVQATGFRAAVARNLTLQINQQARLDVTLQIGDVRQSVEVSAETQLLQTENGTLGEVVGRERIVNLPINGRTFTQLATLTPGVRVTEVNQYNSTGGSRIIANGARDAWLQVNLNGVSMVNNRSNYVTMFPSMDALAEFKVQTGNYSAEYGGNAGANVNVQLRSGTNDFHGVFFEFFRNDKMDSRNFFRPGPFPKDVLRRNQFGTVISGPVVRNKTFFMASYEAIRSTRQSAGTNIVLTPAERRGDFSANATIIRDPFNNNVPFNGNIIPTSRLNPVSISLVNTYMPLPNTTGAVNYAGVMQGALNVDQGLARVDHYFGQKDQVFFHYIRMRRDFPNVELNPNFYYSAEFPNTNLGFQHVHTFSPTFLNEARFGMNKANAAKLSPRTNTNFTIESLGIFGLNVGGPSGRPLRPDEQGFPVMNITGYMGLGDSGASSNLDYSRTFQFVDNVSLIRNSHAFKFGVDVRRLLDDATTNNWPFANMSFTNDITGNGASAFMMGLPRTTLTPEGVPISKIRQWRYALYAQDDWKATSKLTLNIGLRWDMPGQPHEVNAVSRTLRFDIDPKGPVLWPDPGTRADFYLGEYRDFGPRFGFAYRLPRKMVVRGGYGIFYSVAQFDNTNILQLNPPGGGSLTVTNPLLNPVATIQNPVPASLYPNNPIFNVVSVPVDRQRRNAYVQNFNFQLSKELTNNDVLEVGWVATKGTHVDTSLNNFNQPEPGPGDIQARRPYPAYARIRMIAADGNTVYHSLQARFEHRMSRGLSLTGAYTWSHLIDDTGQTINAGGCACQNARNRGKAERASSVLDQRHRLVVASVWELPIFKSGKGFGGRVLGGWSTGAILTLASGFPFNVVQSGDTWNVDALWPRPNSVPGVSPILEGQTPNRWFNTDAFSRSTTYGTAPRNPLTGPGIHTLDFSASKSFRMPFAESHSLLFRGEMFNITNTPQFANPGATLGTGTFGVVTGTQSDNRQVQLALKYSF
ncbi:MAG TPA: TonB-dependent receptor [Bryobacteraceae bacterium]|nr:TonB-dependent receptor [Bryobacteraceae bacterium]